MFKCLFQNIDSYFERDPAARSRLEIMLCYPGYHAVVWYRIASYLWRMNFHLLGRFVSQLGRILTGIEIHPGATIGKRFFIDHGMGVVIGETAEIGDGGHLHQGVTLGGTSTQRTKRHPTLLEDVTVGAGAQIIGAVTIGKGARIGAGSVVVANVPEYATVVGVPGHVVSYYDPGNDTVLRLPDPEHDRLEILEQRVFDLESALSDHVEPEAASEESAPEAPPAANDASSEIDTQLTPPSQRPAKPTA